MIYLELFYIFLKIGAFTFGGGYAMLPLIQDEVIAHNWIDSQSLIDFIAVSESTPTICCKYSNICRGRGWRYFRFFFVQLSE